MPAKPFLDTNVLAYFAGRGEKARTAEALLAEGGVISVQVLNELANVCRRKFGYEWAQTVEVLAFVRRLVETVPLTLATHERGLAIAQRHRVAIYDGMLLASAVESGCDIFWSEDLHPGLVVEDRLTVRNPFA